MVNAGVGLTEALRVTTEALRNKVYIKRLGEVSEPDAGGPGLAGPLAGTGLFPGTATPMLAGRRGDRVARQPARSHRGVLRASSSTTGSQAHRLFEPIVIIVMGLVVGFVAVALVSAMYGIFSQVDV